MFLLESAGDRMMLGSDVRQRRLDSRTVALELLTAGRLALGAATIIVTLEAGTLPLVATLITLNIVAGAVHERLVDWCGGSGVFDALFESFADYLTIIVAPWLLTRTLLLSPRNIFQEILLDLSLVTGAIHYARSAALAVTERAARLARLGLSGVFYGFVAVAAVFLRLSEVVSAAQLTLLLVPAVAVMSVWMIVPLHYPTQAAVPRLSLVMLVLVAVTPFIQTARLTMVVIAAGVLYGVLGHLWVRRVNDR